MLSSSSSVSRWKAISVRGKAGCGGPEGSGTRGARRSWSVAVFFSRASLPRVEGAILDVGVQSGFGGYDVYGLRSMDL